MQVQHLQMRQQRSRAGPKTGRKMDGTMLKIERPLLRALLITLLLVCAAGQRIEAQFQAGNLYGTVTDGDGHPLAGATITLTCDGAHHALVTGDEGEIQFSALSPGNYELRAEHKDFQTVVYPTVEILVGRTTAIHLRMARGSGEARVITS